MPSMSVELEIVEDPARACAAMLVGAVAGRGDIVLTGGSTPRLAYRELVRAVRAVELDLTETTFWFGDERCVEPEDDRSNFALAKTEIFDQLEEGNQPTVQRMRGELGPEQGAEDYERALREAGPPRFDLLMLGLGPDGHVASLFPDQPALSERERLVVGVPESGLEPFVPRISFTLTTIGAARTVLFLVSGAAKADAVAAAFGPQARADTHVPASMVPSVADRVIVLLDPPAAERL
jgi:6-phosphogluconolactonase